MASYKSMIIREVFDDLAEEPGTIWVRLRNPKVATMDHMSPQDDAGEVGPDGKPVDMEKAKASGLEVVAGLIVEWSMPDASSVAEDAPMLPQLGDAPSLEEKVRILRHCVPLAVTNRIGNLFQEAVAPKS